jgi:hypothetical protein
LLAKRASGVAQGEGHEFKPQYWEKKKKSLIVKHKILKLEY